MKRSPLRQRSAKRDAFMRQTRVPLTRAMLAESPWCDLGPAWSSVDPGYRGCQRYAIGLHELRKRGQGGSMTDPANLMRCCGPCNGRVEDEPDLAHAAGLVIRRGDA